MASAEGFLRGRRQGDLVSVAFLLALVASGTLLLAFGSQLTFLLDDWEFLLYRRGFTEQAILDPHGEHISVGPVLVYKALLALFGMDSALPFRVVSTAMFLLSAALLFVYLRRRVDQWLALIAVTLLLFLGAAWEDLLWPFQLGYFTSMVGGLGMLLALERGDRFGDRLACALLTLGILFSSLAIPFALGGAVLILRDAARWRRIYVVAVPLLVFVAWWLGWGHTAESSLSWENIATTPLFLLDGVAAALASLLGLATPYGGAEAPGGLDWGRPLLVGGGLLAAWRLHRIGKIPDWLWIVVAIAAAFWLLTGLNAKEGREPTSSRYQYAGVVFVLMLGAELLRGVRLRAASLAAVAVVAAGALAGNVYYLHEAYQSYRHTSQLERADLAAVEIARDTVEPGFLLEEEIADTGYVHVDAASYLSAAEEFGSPAYTLPELASAPEFARYAADKVLYAALRIVLEPVPRSQVSGRPAAAVSDLDGLVRIPAGRCVEVALGGSAPQLSLPRAGVAIATAAQPVADVRLRRFAREELPIDLQTGIPAGGAAAMRIPPDRSAVPWKLQLDGEGSAVACGLGGETG